MNRFEFRSASGEVCCSSDNPEHLCAKCKAQHNQQRHASRNDARPTTPNKGPLLSQDPNYDPHGAPASGHDIALGRLAPEGGTHISTRHPDHPNYDPRKTAPDGYAIALANRNRGELR
jgi:hypothetical protein